MSDQEVKYMGNDISDYKYATTKFVEVEGVEYAYRSIGNSRGLPVVCLQHFTGTLDNWTRSSSMV